MGELVKQHIKYRDIDNNTITKIEYLQPVSYEKIPEDKRSDPKEEYVCKIYMQGTWAYVDSYRIYNINDTINCYFDKDLKVLRMGDKSVNP
jgi:predicted RNA-binding protein